MSHKQPPSSGRFTVSLPSPRTVVADVPEVKKFKGKFFYNFFQPDERTNDSGASTAEFIRKRPTESFDSSFVGSDQFNRFTARYIKFSWLPVIKETTFVPQEFKIADNINKIHEEQHFISDHYTNITFQDTGIDGKLNYLVKKLAREQQNLDRRTTGGDANGVAVASQMDLVKSMNKQTSDNLNSGILTDALIDPCKEGYVFKNKKGEKLENASLLQELKNVQYSIQINNKFLTNMLGTLRENSFTVFADEVDGFIEQVKGIEDLAKSANTSKIINARDYELEIAEFIDYTVIDHANNFNPKFEILGYFIEKVETTADGDVVVQDPIIIENPTINSAVDVNIKYGSTYTYTIRSVAAFETQVTDEETDDAVALKYLVASRPSPVQVIDCLEEIPPATPSDFNVRWEAIEGAPILEWCFPVNPQRDIKGWQIFKRNSLDEPFELIKFYDFDDSVISLKDPSAETPEKFLTEKLTTPKNFYLDRGFTKNSKPVIYTVCSVDARGLSSNYGIQFQVSFDKLNNKLKKTLISLSGAPKPYPNFFLLRDTFVDSIRDSGHEKLRIVFNPEYLKVVDAENNDLQLLKTDPVSSNYQLSIINVDLQEQNNIMLKLLDKRTTSDQNSKSLVEKRLLQNRTDSFDRLRRRLKRKQTR